jgi:dTDP-4-amino-4,6-dideoxygalactose transaminase
MGGKEQKYIKEAFDTNWVAPLGPNVTGFEQDIEKYIGENLCRSLSSGTAAIHLGLILLGVKAGDEVLVKA